MKFRLFTACTLLLAVFLTGCLRDECVSEQTYTRYDPVYIPISTVRSDLKVESPRELKAPGKIYALGNYLFINEIKEGIHVIDNSDPSNPKNTAFWNIPGNVDMVVNGNYLYVDQYIDLLTVDITDLDAPKMLCRSENVFPLYGIDALNGVLVDYRQTEVTEKFKCNDSRVAQTWFMEGDVLWATADQSSNNTGGPRKNSTSLPGTVGIAGSYARFGIADNYLYTVDNWQLRSWSLANPTCPSLSQTTNIGWNAETIFPFKDRLFIGSQTGVFIFDNRNPAQPVLESMFSHASGCDPVVCDDNYAYVTIHDGTTCNGTFNQLDIVDIKNLPTSSLVKTFEMKRPFGLSITNDHLFLCDDGLKIFDKSDPLNLQLLSHQTGIAAYDVIAFSDEHLMLIGDDGFFQYDVSDPAAPKQLSAIPVAK